MSDAYQIDLLKARVSELEQWQEKAREDIARMEAAIVQLAALRSAGDFMAIAPSATMSAWTPTLSQKSS